MKVGDLVKIEDGEMGIVTSLTRPHWADWTVGSSAATWYEIALASGTKKFIRSDIIRVLNESR